MRQCGTFLFYLVYNFSSIFTSYLVMMACEISPKLNWKNTDVDKESLPPSLDWDALLEYAARVKQAQSHDDEPSPTCKLLPQYNMGGLHLVRQLQFDDGTIWIARIQLHGGSDESAKKLLHEVHTMFAIQARVAVPVPKVFGFESTDKNPVGAAFILMEFIPGDTAMDSSGGYYVHRGEIPSQHKTKFSSQVARLQTRIASVRFPKIGRITQLDDGSFTVVAIPGIGGPFSTAADYLAAWAGAAKFGVSEKYLPSLLPPELEKDLRSSIAGFPSMLRAMSHRLPLRNGPFPLYHPDLFHSNIIIDNNYDVLAIIDWEDACTVPWEVVEFPLFLSTIPPSIDAPWDYDERGEPTDAWTVQQWREQKEYVQTVIEVEDEELASDHVFSSTLADRRAQDLAGAMKLYQDPGKIAYYCKAFESWGDLD